MVWNGKNERIRGWAAGSGGRGAAETSRQLGLGTVAWCSSDDLRDSDGRGLDVRGLELETTSALEAPAGGGHRSGEAAGEARLAAADGGAWDCGCGRRCSWTEMRRGYEHQVQREGEGREGGAVGPLLTGACRWRRNDDGAE